MRKLTRLNHYRAFLLAIVSVFTLAISTGGAQADVIDPSAEDYAVTAEMLDPDQMMTTPRDFS